MAAVESFRLDLDSPDVPAKPKGSLRHVGGNRLVEHVAGSKAWREYVAFHARAAATRQRWQTATGPVEATIRVFLARPKTVTRDWPSSRHAGDVDKHARNILDALSDAQIYRDDSQVVHLDIKKQYANICAPGVQITITPID